MKLSKARVAIGLLAVVAVALPCFALGGKKTGGTETQDEALYTEHEFFSLSESYVILVAGGEAKKVSVTLENGTPEGAEKIKWRLDSEPEKKGKLVCKVRKLPSDGNTLNFEVAPKSLGKAHLEFANETLAYGHNWTGIFINVVTETEYQGFVKEGLVAGKQ